jgi:hypothetical protein
MCVRYVNKLIYRSVLVLGGLGLVLAAFALTAGHGAAWQPAAHRAVVGDSQWGDTPSAAGTASPGDSQWGDVATAPGQPGSAGSGS